MKSKKRWFVTALTACLTLSLGICAEALEYDFDGVEDTEYYPSTNYESLYGAKYNYGGSNATDYQWPALPYRLSSKENLMKRIYHFYLTCMTLTLTMPMMIVSVFAVDDMWTVANNIIVDVYGKIVGVSTVLAGLMSAVAVIGAKLSNNQHKVDQAWDWLKRIWIAWAIINGIGAFIAYVAPLFNGLATLTP